MNVYSNPYYYEIAFSFVNAKKQVDFFEKLIKKHSKCKVNSFLDIACGPSLQLRELAIRKYTCVGLDKSKEMLVYLENMNSSIRTLRVDMTNFKIKDKIDFAFIMMGSISYIKSNNEFLNHLDSVADCLRNGSLYFIENFRLDWSFNLFKEQKWVEKKNDVRVDSKYKIELVDILDQLLMETLTLDVHDSGKRKIFRNTFLTKQIFPEEFKLLIENNSKFEFLGFFQPFTFRKLNRECNFNYVLLRKKSKTI